MNYSLASVSRKHLIYLASSVPKSVEQKLIGYILKNREEDINIADVIQKLSEDCRLSISELLDLVGLYTFLDKMHRGGQSFSEILHSLGFSDKFADNFTIEHEIGKELPVMDSHLGIEKLSKFKWRVDISIASGVISKRLPPSFIVNIQLSNGKNYILELDIKTFHRLRYIISVALNELIILKARALKRRIL